MRSTPLSDDPFGARDGGADDVGREHEGRVRIEGRGDALLGQLDPVALHAGVLDLARIALGRDRLDLDGLGRRLRGSDDGPGREVEGDPEHVGVLDVEHAVFVQVVGLPAKRAADHLLTQELGAEGPDAEDVGDGVRVPALGQHGDGDDAADASSQAVLLADGVHDFAKELLI